MRVLVEYTERLVNSRRTPERFGSWSETYDSEITDVRQIPDEEKATYNSDVFLVPDDTETVWVVSMIYSTGDSFGRATGRLDVLHVTANEELAHQLAKSIEQTPDEYQIAFQDDLGRDVKIYNPGAGYFESIDYVSVDSYSVGTSTKKRRYYVQ